MATIFQDILSSLNSQQGGEQSAQLKKPVATTATPSPSPVPATTQSSGTNIFQQLLSALLNDKQAKPGYGAPGITPSLFSAFQAPQPDNPLSKFMQSAGAGKVGPNLPVTSDLLTNLALGKKVPTYNPAQVISGFMGFSPESLAEQKKYATIQQTPTGKLSKEDVSFAQKYAQERMMWSAMGSIGGVETKGGTSLEKAVGKGVRQTIEEATGVTKNVLGEPLPWEENGVAKVIDESVKQSQKPIKDVSGEVTKVAESIPEIIDKTVVDVKDKVNILDTIRTPDRVLKKMGLETQATDLRNAYNNYLRELPKEIDKITNWANEIKGIPDASRRIFRYLDGEKYIDQKPLVLTDTEKKVATEMQDYLKSWADKLRLPPEARLTNYITHIFPKGLVEKEFDPELAKIISSKIASSVYDPFVEKRLGKLGYKEDAIAALDAYVKRATRKVNLDSPLKRLSEAANGFVKENYNYVKSYVDHINMRPSDTETLIDNFIKSTPVGYRLGQRPFNTLSQAGRQMVYRATLGLNPNSALKNLTQGVNTYAKLGEKYTLIGYFQAATKRGLTSEFEDVLGKNLIEDRTLSASKRFWTTVDPVLYKMFDAVEYINRASAYWGAKQMALDKGMTEEAAKEFGKKTVMDTQFMFSSIDAPQALQGDIGKLLLQFQTYNIKQLEFLGEMAQAKDFAGLIRYTLGSLLVINTVGKAIGMKWTDMVPSIRVGGSPLFSLAGDIGSLPFPTKDQYGNVPTFMSKLKKVQSDVAGIIPAGVEIRRLMKQFAPTTKAKKGSLGGGGLGGGRLGKGKL